MECSICHKIYKTKDILAKHIGRFHSPDYQSKEWLYNQYVILKKSTFQIQKEFGYNHRTISTWLKKHNIPSRKKGWKQTEESNKKRSLSKLNEKNPMWKGNQVGYWATHNWVRRRKMKPELCERCNEEKAYDLANISGEYKRDITDYLWLCRKCHMKSDGRMFLRDDLGKFKRKGE